MGFDLGIKNSEFLESDYNHYFEFLHFGVFEVDIEGTCYPLDFYCKLAPVCFDFVLRLIWEKADCLKVVVLGHNYIGLLEDF